MSKRQKEPKPFYRENYDHLADELRWLDRLIELHVNLFRFRTEAAARAASSQPMFISDGQVDWLLNQREVVVPGQTGIQEDFKQLEIERKRIQEQVVASLERRVYLTLPQLAHLFGLTPFEIQALLICLAPELDRKYDTLYAYLQDDITRKKPSVDLILQLLCGSYAEQWSARALLADQSTLLRAGILEKVDDPASPSGSSALAQFLKVDARIVDFLIGRNHVDVRLVHSVRMLNPAGVDIDLSVAPEAGGKLLQLAQNYLSEQARERRKLIVHLRGPYGAGKKHLAMWMCRQLGWSMLVLDLEKLVADERQGERLALAFRDGLLLQAALYLENVDVLQESRPESKSILKRLGQVIEQYGWLTFFSGSKAWAPKEVFGEAVFYTIELGVPAVPLRQAVWENALQSNRLKTKAGWAGQLANQFRLTPGQISDAVTVAMNQWATTDRKSAITLGDLYAACRSQSNQKLAELAVKIEPRVGWQDLILPKAKLNLLQEICSQIHHRYRVLGEWGFGSKLSRGKGLTVLFSGPPGTGKTMAAEVIAQDLELDLYKIDLSAVVSKYIGETEKNLAKIFEEAETSNAILFFDEADALFGKRTEVSDAHDRYANIETSYLLQRMDEYEGLAILATNLRENMDAAFTRRIRFIVEFPFPDEASRRQIWKTHFPPEAPVAESMDYELLSKQFQIAGGSIKNIVLNSAYLAAANGGVIEIEHVMASARQEFEKMGKLWSDQVSPGRSKV